jgi:hypothetical protein
MATSTVSRRLSDYSHLRTLPAMLSVVFVGSSLYQFGGVAELHFVWLDYTLTTTHGVFLSLLAYAVAFASSETKQFEHYEDWEQAVIASGPALIILHHMFTYVQDLVATDSHTGPILAFAVTVVSWGVAVK